MKNGMKVKKVSQPTRTTSVLPPELYNSLAEYANKEEIYNMSVVVRQAVAFFLQNKTIKNN